MERAQVEKISKALADATRLMIFEAISAKDHVNCSELVYWVYNDVCPPAPGCVAAKTPPVAGGGVPYAAMWQYVQSPRRKEYTAKCAATYSADGNCYAPGDTAHAWFLDLNSAKSADPSSAE